MERLFVEIEEEIKMAFNNNKRAIWAARNYRPWIFFLCSSRMFHECFWTGKRVEADVCGPVIFLKDGKYCFQIIKNRKALVWTRIIF